MVRVHDHHGGECDRRRVSRQAGRQGTEKADELTSGSFQTEGKEHMGMARGF